MHARCRHEGRSDEHRCHRAKTGGGGRSPTFMSATCRATAAVQSSNTAKKGWTGWRGVGAWVGGDGREGV